jgi:hypothetical protein
MGSKEKAHKEVAHWTLAVGVGYFLFLSMYVNSDKRNPPNANKTMSDWKVSIGTPPFRRA